MIMAAMRTLQAIRLASRTLKQEALHTRTGGGAGEDPGLPQVFGNVAKGALLVSVAGLGYMYSTVVDTASTKNVLILLNTTEPFLQRAGCSRARGCSRSLPACSDFLVEGGMEHLVRHAASADESVRREALRTIEEFCGGACAYQARGQLQKCIEATEGPTRVLADLHHRYCPPTDPTAS